MSLNYGDDVRLVESVVTPEPKGRMLTPYHFVYGELARGIAVSPKTIPGYPNDFIAEELDDDSYIILHVLSSDTDTNDLSGVVIKMWLLVYRFGLNSGVYRTIETFSLDDLIKASPITINKWQLRKRYSVKSLLTNIDLSDVSHMYLTMGLQESASGNPITNEWSMSMLLNSPNPSH